MKSLLERSRLPLLVLAVFAIPGARLAWVASRAEVGWDVVAVQWRDATLGWFVGEHRPVPSRSPAEQADFWLAEVERVLAQEPESAELAMGAAWVLEQEALSYSNEKELKVLKATCREACLRLAQRATELEPGNPDWWRLRVLLLLRPPFWLSEFSEPRDPSWESVLADAARHDPQNSLYDYLAASVYWSRGRFDSRDPERFRRGEEHFDRAVNEKLLAIGEGSFPAVAEFLSRTSLPKPDQAAVAARLRCYGMYAQNVSGIRLRCALELRDGGRGPHAVRRHPPAPPSLLEQTRELLGLLQQVEAAEEPGELSTTIGHRTWHALRALRGLAAMQPGTAVDAVPQKLEVRAEQLSAIWENRLRQSRRADAKSDPQEWADDLSAHVAQARLNTAARLIPGALFGLLATWIVRKPRSAKADLGTTRHGVAWGLGFGVVFLALAYRTAIWPLSDEIRAAAPEIVSHVFRGSDYWQQFAMRWFAFPTYATGAVISLSLVSAWSIVRSAGDWRWVPQFLFSGPAAKWAGLIACVSRSAVGLGGVLLLLYLLAAPDAVRVAEREFQQKILPVRDPAAYWAEFNEAVALSESRAPGP